MMTRHLRLDRNLGLDTVKTARSVSSADRRYGVKDEHIVTTPEVKGGVPAFFYITPRRVVVFKQLEMPMRDEGDPPP